MKMQDLSVQFNQTHSQATLWSISSIPPNLIAVCFDSNQLFSALLHWFPWTHIILPRLQLNLGIWTKTVCHREHRAGGVCGLSQLSPGQGERGRYLTGPSRPRKDDNFSFKVSFKPSSLPHISMAMASGAAQRAEPHAGTEETLSLNNLWSHQAWQRGKGGRDTCRGVFSYLFGVTKPVEGITRTKAALSSGLLV